MPRALALPSLLAVLSVPALARAQPGAAPPAAAPPAAEQPTAEQSMCWHGGCGPDRARRFAVGIAGGHIDLDDAGEGHQHSIFGRVMIAHGFAVELELARAELDDEQTAKTGGFAIDKFFFTHRHLNPYIAAGAGGGRLERSDGSESKLGYGELGGGLLLRGRRLGLALDLRAGVRRSEAAEATVAAAMTGPSDSDDDDDWERDRYHRARLMLLVQF